MSKTVLHDGDEGVTLVVRDVKAKRSKTSAEIDGVSRSPVHVFYGGADRYGADTSAKAGRIALATLSTYAPNVKAFEEIFRIDGSTAGAIYDATKAKLAAEPVEDLRIDFEDGYGFRTDAEEDADAVRTANELAATLQNGSITVFSGFRIKAYATETRERAKRTLQIFLAALLKATNGNVPDNFVVTLPKVTDKKEVGSLCRDLRKIEKKWGLGSGSIKIEIMIEHPLALIDRKGNVALKGLVEATGGRCIAAHFGAYDHTAALGIAASHQDIGHPACDLARQMMLLSLAPLGIRLSDSVTPQMPVAIHRGDKLSAAQIAENKASVQTALRVHFQNVTRSMSQGFYQSWDLHPNQLIARYAAVYAFFLEALDEQGARLRSFVQKATQATLTGNTFDDAATAMGIVNFLRQGLDCSALSEAQIEKATGLTATALRNNSFREIVAAPAT